MNRRLVLASFAAASMVRPARAGEKEDIDVDVEEGAMHLTRYVAPREGKRPYVLVLHGSRGIELRPRAYQRYAGALTASGIDAYLLRYFTAVDSQALDPKTSTKESREAYDRQRFSGWA